jgi:hypothetical protein
VALGIGFSAIYWAVSDAHAAEQTAACVAIGTPCTVYASAYAALVCGAAGFGLHFVLSRGVRRRGWVLASAWQGRASSLTALLGWVPLAMEALNIYFLYRPDPSGGVNCEGWGVIHSVLSLLT